MAACLVVSAAVLLTTSEGKTTTWFSPALSHCGSAPRTLGRSFPQTFLFVRIFVRSCPAAPSALFFGGWPLTLAATTRSTAAVAMMVHFISIALFLSRNVHV